MRAEATMLQPALVVAGSGSGRTDPPFLRPTLFYIMHSIFIPPPNELVLPLVLNNNRS
jgi:hypothetical protein